MNENVKQTLKDYDELLGNYKELRDIELNTLLSSALTSTEGFTSNNTNVNGGLEQYDILLKRYKKLYQLEIKKALDYKDINVKTFIQPITIKLTYPKSVTNAKFKYIISQAVDVHPSQVIIIKNNTQNINNIDNLEFTIIQNNKNP
jgi:hypothetical protein